MNVRDIKPVRAAVAHESGTLCVQGCTETVKGKMFQDFNLVIYSSMTAVFTLETAFELDTHIICSSLSGDIQPL